MHVFVYGTLTDPERVEIVLDGRPPTEYAFDGSATLEGLRRVDGEYPTLAPGGTVDGQLLSVDETALERLDRYEGVDRGLYVRVSVPIDGHNNSDNSDDGAAVYVGDPARLAVDEPIDWPAGDSFADRVRTSLTRRDVTVRRPG
ncbi:gamma-glutamylcyclotransferase family protein [Halopiger xanaduensis]|uniref:gamma-glutamylcyclotransferase family protein n=1 Tax=Halopiger xanaduensis TaxID=387343 RepID=UPI0006778437|nr:gamma-glutamylcyclotransferase family protein [Halopiger xanaduensis]